MSAGSERLRTADGRTIDLDPTFSPAPGDPAIAILPVARRVLARHDPAGESLRIVDELGAAADLQAALTVGGVSLWPRRRLVAWRRLHDLIMWRGIIAELGIEPGAGLQADDAADLPEPLRDLLGLSNPDAGAETGADAGRSRAGRPAAANRRAPSQLRLIARGVRRLVGAAPDAPKPSAAATAMAAALAADRANLATWFTGDRRPLLVLSDAGVFQTVDTPAGPVRLDPFLAPIVDRLRSSALEPVVVELSRDRPPADPGERRVSSRAITAATDEPSAIASAAVMAAAVSARLAIANARIDLDGIDVGPRLVDAERAFAQTGVAPWILARDRIERFLAAHRPAGILMINEYSRPEWLAAARAAGIPVAAVQHGIIHRVHAGYVMPPRTPATILADRTWVFGAYERNLLLAHGYREDEVVVGGAPRLDLLRGLDTSRDDAAAAAAREALRTQLGARPGERLVVFSSTNNGDVRRLVVAPALAAILDRPLPNVRLVVKLHPAEAPHDLYERLAAGLAGAGGFDPPPISTIREVDLFGLLRAADAHLGIHSTVLTDAIVAGVRNLIFVGFPGSDLLDYVDRGVARPVRNGVDLLAALSDSSTANPTDRAAFLGAHLAAGDASERVAGDLVAWLGR